MTSIEIARRLAQLGEKKQAVKAYTLAVHNGCPPEEEFEAAVYILYSGEDYRVAYTCLLNLYGRGFRREECLDILTQAFYEPNVKALKARYRNNCKRLEGYPYLFRKDFPAFEELTVRFFPFDDKGYVPFYPAEGRFGAYVNFNHPVISRNFFHDLDKPVLAEDVYSQYELEYLNDNVRRSEHVGKDNHIYLHYTDWGLFCAHLQVLNMRPLIEEKKWEKKIVFLMEDEGSQYPIDFKARFRIDYSDYLTVAVGVRDVTRLIWHTQLSSHNGGDFFNEIFDNHPNLLALPSIMHDSVDKAIEECRSALAEAESEEDAVQRLPQWKELAVRDLYLLKDRTDKDILVGWFLSHTPWLDTVPRIVPTLFFQPHFHNMDYDLLYDDHGHTMLTSQNYDKMCASPLLRGFKYVKTLTPMRRPTTSYGAAVKFMWKETKEGVNEKGQGLVVGDEIYTRLCNRSFMVDGQERLFMDSILVRFEDAKLNPTATFKALAAFLDIPYTESMTYCSMYGQRDPESLEGNDIGFSTAAVYRTYDDFANDTERYFLEYFLRDVYEYYGYDFKYYDGAPMDEKKVEKLVKGFTTLNALMRETWGKNVFNNTDIKLEAKNVSAELTKELDSETRKIALDQYMEAMDKNRLEVAKLLLKGQYFINRKGQPLHMMPKLKLDPALLEQPLYH